MLLDTILLTDLLNHIKKQHDVNVIGFYIIKRVRKWDLERHVGDYKDYYDKKKSNEYEERIN